MKSKPTKAGIVLLMLIVLIPVIFYFTHTGAKEKLFKESTKQQETKGKPAKTTGAMEKNTSLTKVKTEEENTSPVMKENQPEAMKENAVTASSGTGTDTSKQPVQNSFLVVIDPGHQIRADSEPEPVGPGAKETKMKVTGGTSGVATGKPEYKLTLEASLVLGEILKSKGIKVIFTRTSDNVNLSNRDRAEIANQNHANLFVRIHADGSTDRNVHGLSVLTPDASDQYTKAIFADSLKASQYIIAEVSKNQTVKVNGISYREDMSGFNWSKVPSTLVELGFMTNPSEDKNLSDPVYLNNLLGNLANGIMDFANDKEIH